jgi:hypothetical protein
MTLTVEEKNKALVDLLQFRHSVSGLTYNPRPLAAE